MPTGVEKKLISGASQTEIDRIFHDVQARHEKPSRSLFFGIGAALLGGLYFSLLLMLGLCIRLICGRSENEIAHQLGFLHSYVPEMAFQKIIELEALEQNDVSGKGLDLGCGNGFTGSVFMHRIGADDYHGIDRQAGFVSPLELGYASLTVGEIEALPFADETFDFLVAICVIEHIPEFDRALSEICRVLKPGGALICTVPMPNFSEANAAFRFYQSIGAKKKSAQVRKMDEIVSLHYNLLSDIEWDKILRRQFKGEVTIKEICSREQALLVDVFSVSRRFPDFDSHAMAYNVFLRFPVLKRIFGWATGVIAARIARMKVEGGNGTLFSICARKAEKS